MVPPWSATVDRVSTLISPPTSSGRDTNMPLSESYSEINLSLLYRKRAFVSSGALEILLDNDLGGGARPVYSHGYRKYVTCIILYIASIQTPSQSSRVATNRPG